MSATIRILVVDDHLVFRMGLKTLLQSEPDMEVVAEAENGAQCILAYEAHKPTVVLMDMRMPGEGGIDAIAAIQSLDPNAKILMLTSYGSEEEIYQAIQRGARGYVIKDVNRKYLVTAIREVAQGKRWMSKEIATRLAERLLRPKLTGREIEILQLMFKGLINREIANVLGLSQSTIKNQINALFVKLEVTDRTEAVATALQRGILQLD